VHPPIGRPAKPRSSQSGQRTMFRTPDVAPQFQPGGENGLSFAGGAGGARLPARAEFGPAVRIGSRAGGARLPHQRSGARRSRGPVRIALGRPRDRIHPLLQSAKILERYLPRLYTRKDVLPDRPRQTREADLRQWRPPIRRGPKATNGRNTEAGSDYSRLRFPLRPFQISSSRSWRPIATAAR
jgi:hypothetical protein